MPGTYAQTSTSLGVVAGLSDPADRSCGAGRYNRTCGRRHHPQGGLWPSPLVQDLVDQSFPSRRRDPQIISGHCTDVIDFHRLGHAVQGRTVRGRSPDRPRTATLEAYGIVKHLEDDIRHEFPRTNVTIRVQPCTGSCSACGVFATCPECDHHSRQRRSEIEGRAPGRASLTAP